MTTQPFTVTFIKQGGLLASGTAIARKGSQLLIQYKIQSGELRQRWIPAKRIENIFDQDIKTLPRHIAQSCAGWPLLDEERENAPHFAYCKSCTQNHEATYRYDRVTDRRFIMGYKSLKLQDRVCD